MPRKLRIEYPGAIYHVTARGNGRQNIFRCIDDRVRLLKRLSASLEDYGVRLYLYCLMSNHIHLLIETPSANLSRFMQSVMTGYSMYFNLKHNTAGHVFQGRFGARVVEGNEYLLRLSRYVHLNPVHTVAMESATLQTRQAILKEYLWSSYRAYIGLDRKPEWLNTRPILAQTGEKMHSQSKLYRRYVESGLARTDEEFNKIMRTGSMAIGAEEFCGWVEDQAIRKKAKLRHPEDVEFRQKAMLITEAEVLGEVGKVLKLGVEEVVKRQRGNCVRGITAKMLIKYAGLTGRRIAQVLGLKSGSGISWQLAQLEEAQRLNQRLVRVVEQIERALKKRQSLSAI